MPLYDNIFPYISWIQDTFSQFVNQYFGNTDNTSEQSFEDNDYTDVTKFAEEIEDEREINLNDEDDEEEINYLKDRMYGMEDVDDEDDDDEEYVSVTSEQQEPESNQPKTSMFDLYKRSSVINKRLSQMNPNILPFQRKYTSSIGISPVTREEIKSIIKSYKKLNPNYVPKEHVRYKPGSPEEKKAIEESLKFVEWYKNKFS